MEEILASIKRVIAEEGRTATAPRPARNGGRPPLSRGDEDVLELGEPVPEGEGLISDNAAEASRRALTALAGLRDQRGADYAAGDGPLEAVVREMLRPMLKEWLDQNLPEIVQALVTREIARITRQSF